MVNIYDNVNGVAADLRETEQFKNLQAAVTQMHADAAAEDVFKQFQAAQLEINSAMQSGQEPAKESVEAWQAIAKEMEQFDVLKTMMDAEQAMNALLQEINQIITKPLAELYS
ncbi:MAG: YlbF family regulator [Lactobacillaceae bacterium]|jgi:cell fate (sporulation/competence/biofilm development) regulator YlbF (YheA/YmcA/DUF963 family)|nr:YlbF family regulator [Lactobacillaceae bacterium]